MSARHSIIRSSTSSPASNSMRRTAESVTSSSTNAMGRMCSPTSFFTYFMCSLSGKRILAKMRGTIFSPTKLWLWKVQPCLSSQCLVDGLPMSWNKAAHRSHSLSLSAATLSSTCIVCRKLSLWPRPFTVSTPFKLAISGQMSCSNPLLSSRKNPREGFDERIIFISSSAMRSRVIIFMRPALRLMAAKVPSSISKPN